MDKQFVRIKVADLVPYETNPRKIPKEAIDDVVESYRQCGVIDPIEINEDNVILSGHTRRLAAIELGLEELDCLRVTGLSEEQQKKYRLLANKTSERSSWDLFLLDQELQTVDFGEYDFGFETYDEIGKKEGASVNPTASLPHSKVYVFCISAFGTDSEVFLQADLSQEEADFLLERYKELQAKKLIEKIRGALHGI